MIDLPVLLKILPLFLLAMISPGPDFMVVSSISLHRGRSDGIKTAAGIATIITFYTWASLLGLSALFSHYVRVALAIKLCGGLYLIYLGYVLWRSSLTARQSSAPTKTPPQIKNAYWSGALTCLTNPKAIAFFASIFALALTPHTTLATKAVLGIIAPIVTFLWFSFVAIGLSENRVRLRYQRWQHLIDRVTGTLLGFFGLKLFFAGRRHIL